MENKKNALSWGIRILLSLLFLLSAYAKIYHEPSAYFSITTFEANQLAPLGIDPFIAAIFSRVLIAIEFTLGILILFPFYLRKITIPATIGILTFFCIHLGIQILLKGNDSNCGCFGALLPMSPLQAIIKNVLAIGLLIILYKLLNVQISKKNDLLFFFPFIYLITSLLFVYIPIKHTEEPKQTISEFADNLPFVDEGRVLLCFFAPGCEHCRAAIRSIDSLSKIIPDFPKVEIVFMEEEVEKIPNFFKHAGKEYNYQILDIASFYNVLTWERDTPGVFYMWNGNLIKEFNGINDEKFRPSELINALNSHKKL